VKYASEDEIKQALEIDSWRNLSREKVIKFAAMMPEMDKEVALSIVAQLPVFTKFGLDALKVMERVHESTLNFNERSQKNVHQAYREIREVLRDELKQEELSPEEKKFLIESLMNTGTKEFEKDSENKKFLEGLAKNVAIGAGAIVLGAVVFVGGKVMLEQENGGSSSES
jgi:hypothetical protein